MFKRATVVIPTCGRPDKLRKALRALEAQELPRGLSLEVLVAIDGDEDRPAYGQLDRPADTRFFFLPRQGMGASRNAAIEQATGDLLISANDDTYPRPNWVAEHVRAHAQRGRPGLVVGLTAWREWENPTVFDVLLRDTSMVFFFDRMRAGEMYGFRHAWGCNTSLPMALVQSVGGYEKRLRPYGYEDLEFAFRLEEQGFPGVYYHPHAVNVHDHRMSWADYRRRETALGRMAPRLGEINPKCFEAVFRRRDVDRMRGEFESWLEHDRGDHEAADAVFGKWACRPFKDVPDWPELRSVLYHLHRPLKRRCFRQGFVAGCDLRNNDRWFDQP